MRPTSSPPTSRAPPGNGTPNWRSFARQWQRPGEAAHIPDGHGQRPQDERVPADLGDHLFACVAVGAAPEWDDLVEAADGELRREGR